MCPRCVTGPGVRLFAALAVAASLGGGCDEPPSGASGPPQRRAELAPPEPTDLERLGEGLPDAIAAALAEVRAAPAAPAPRLALAQLYESNALVELARRGYAQAAQLAGESPADAGLIARARYHEARMARELGDFDAARIALDETLERAPDYAPAWRRLGEWWLEDGDFEAAKRAFERVRELAPELPDGALGLAKTALSRGDAQRAEALARGVLAAHEDERYAQHLLGSALRELRRAAEAERAFARSEGWSPTFADPWLDEAQAYVSGYNRALNEAKALLAAGRAEECLRRLEGVFAAHPDDVTVQGMLTAALVALERFDEAHALLADAQERQPEHFRIALNRAIVHWKSGALDAALEALDRALALHPDHATALFLRGQVLGARGDAAAAVEAYRKALAAGAEPRSVLPRLGQLEVALERYDAAVETYRRAARELPDSASMHAYLAGSLVETGALAAAREALERARALDPDHPLLEALAALIGEHEARAAAEHDRPGGGG